MSELGGSQISTLLEALLGIANVLRSPVADALVNTIRAAARIAEFQLADAEELVRYATRRGLLGSDEGDRLLADVQEAYRRRADRAADRARTHKAKGKAKSVKSVKTVKRAAPSDWLPTFSARRRRRFDDSRLPPALLPPPLPSPRPPLRRSTPGRRLRQQPRLPLRSPWPIPPPSWRRPPAPGSGCTRPSW